MTNPLVIVAVLLVILLTLIFSGMWIAVALGVVGAAAIYLWLDPRYATLMAEFSWNTLNSFEYACIPLFVFLGYILTEGKLGAKIYSGLEPVLNHFSGGLLHTNIVAGALFASATGSSAASAATIGTLALNEMEKRGYSMGLATGTIAAGGVLAILIPPSIALIVYAMIVEESIGRLFIAGVIPGILLTLAYMTYVGIRVKMKPELAGRMQGVVPWKQALRATVNIWPILILIVVILGLIYLGVATPTESAGVGCAAALVMTAMYKRLNWNMLKRSLIGTARVSSMVILIVMGGLIMNIPISNLGIAQGIAKAIANSGLTPTGILAIVFVMYLLMGMVIPGLAMLVLTLPVIYPVMMSLGFDSVWFGIIVTMLDEVAIISPPVAANLYIIKGLRPDIPFSVLAKGAIPFCAVTMVVIIIVTIFPQIVLFLPNVMIGK